ncbi:MAG: hypothetical protein SWY16_16845 [Cyanobacteriota bacterium]|nr:hypothetical protein [Cyanobacteriota bacterium]
MRNNTAFVGVKKYVSTAELQHLLERLKQQRPQSYYFLRWHHKVSGIVEQCNEAFPSPEGQMFDADLELRWKQLSENSFTLLLLSTTEGEPGFEPLMGNWEFEDRAANICAEIETPIYATPSPSLVASKYCIGQRYFRDRDTATVHFIALTVTQKA